MYFPVNDVSNPIVVTTIAERDALLNDTRYRIVGLSVKVDDCIYWLNADLQTWSPKGTFRVNSVPLIITSAGGAVATEVVRLASAGVLAKAQADTAAHAASVIGVYDGAAVLPFTAYSIVKFDSAPVVGQPCYLSATVAGAMTSTAPTLGGFAVPQNIVVLEDMSVGTDYAARVGVSASDIPILTREQDLMRIASAAIGVAPQLLTVTFDDFNRLGTNGVAMWGGGGGGTTGGIPSVLHQSSGDLYHYSALPDAVISARKWYWEFRFRQYTLTTGFTIGLVRKTDATHGYEVVGTKMLNEGGWQFIVFHQDLVGAGFNPWTQNPANADQYEIVQAEDILFHTLRVWCTGDGIVHYQWDSQAPVAYAQAASGQTGIPYIRYYGASVDLDYVFFAQGV